MESATPHWKEVEQKNIFPPEVAKQEMKGSLTNIKKIIIKIPYIFVYMNF